MHFSAKFTDVYLIAKGFKGNMKLREKGGLGKMINVTLFKCNRKAYKES